MKTRSRTAGASAAVLLTAWLACGALAAEPQPAPPKTGNEPAAGAAERSTATGKKTPATAKGAVFGVG